MIYSALKCNGDYRISSSNNNLPAVNLLEVTNLLVVNSLLVVTKLQKIFGYEWYIVRWSVMVLMAALKSQKNYRISSSTTN